MSAHPGPRRPIGGTERGIRCLGAAAAIAIAAFALAATGCAAKRPPVNPELRDRTERNPIVVIPGITGTQLLDRETGAVAWGRGRNLLVPRDRGYGSALPIDGSPPAKVAGDPVWGFRFLGAIPVRVYGEIERWLTANGYVTGDLDAPTPDATLYFFPYDWRRGAAEAAGALRDALERLRDVHGGTGARPVRIDVLCQSNAAQIARYFVKYGGAPIEDAEAGTARPLEGVLFERVVFVGSAQSGSLRVLREMNRGRRYVPWVGRKTFPEALFGFPSLYEALPLLDDDRFIDASGTPVDASLADPGDWERYGWSVFDPKVATRVERAGRPDLFGTLEDRRAFLAAQLDRARRLQRLLMRDVADFPPTKYHVVGSAYAPTTARAVLTRDGDGWLTSFTDDRAVRRDAFLHGVAAAPGDGHATFESQVAMSPQEIAALAGPPWHVDRPHFKIILDRGVWEHLARLLADPHPPISGKVPATRGDPRKGDGS